MDIKPYQILDSDFVGKGVSAQPNPMELPEDEAKAVFDQLVKEVLTPKYNAFLKAMEKVDLTEDLEKPISHAVQKALDTKHDKELRTGSKDQYRTLTDNNYTDEEKEKVATADKQKHTHGNKTLLDGLKQTDIDNWNGGNVLTKDNTEPYEPRGPYQPATQKYVDDKVVSIGAADMMAAVYDPQGRRTDIFKEIDDVRIKLPPDFDNLLAWAGCKRMTPKKEGNSYTETITDKASGKLRAKRVTVQNGENDYTETYTFYGEDGSSVVQKYVVRTTKDGKETWTEDVTKEVV